MRWQMRALLMCRKRGHTLVDIKSIMVIASIAGRLQDTVRFSSNKGVNTDRSVLYTIKT